MVLAGLADQIDLLPLANICSLVLVVGGGLLICCKCSDSIHVDSPLEKNCTSESKEESPGPFSFQIL